MNEWAGGIIVTKDGKVALQQREDKLGITLPGKIVMFGGTVEVGETPERGALREWDEELTLKIQATDMEKLGVFNKTMKLDGEDYVIHVFVVMGVDKKDLALKEGRSIVYIDKDDDWKDMNLSRITKLALTTYFGR